MIDMISTSIGWLGVCLCTLGYLLLSTKKLTPESWGFQAFNIVGGLCLLATAIMSNDIPNAVANLLWASIGFYALTRRWRTKGASEVD
ncbi:CBU_0592 family membrane protein [Pedobacter nutrimenti]|uniref:CBU_0592 family membrane protein n=1 Tax=Pedobacter nutrimenti TaxID=1241337 RepID=UPI002931F13D|nr:hypothetical protein [Pedobacter nutrimenti]